MLKFESLKSGYPVDTTKGPGKFQKHKPGNFKGQTVQVLLTGQTVPVWFKEKNVFELEKKG